MVNKIKNNAYPITALCKKKIIIALILHNCFFTFVTNTINIPKNRNTIIGKKLQALRKERGFSQEQVADKLHISQSAYARIESGESHSWTSHILKICETYEITPEELVSSENIVINNNQQGGNPTNAIIVNQLSEKLIQQYEERIKEKDLIINELRNRLA